MYFPDRGCIRTLRTLYVYATAIMCMLMKQTHCLRKLIFRTIAQVSNTVITFHIVIPVYSIVIVSQTNPSNH